MYPAIKSNAINESEARQLAGDNAVDNVLHQNCDFTNRVIDECYNVVEMSASVDFDDQILTVLYLIDKQDAMDTDDLGSLDYSDYTFVID